MKRMLMGFGIIVLFAATLTMGSIAPTRAADFTGEFDVSAEIPDATQVVFEVTRITDGTPSTWEDFPEGSQELPFVMKYDDGEGIWLPEKYYAIDLSSRDAGGNLASGTPDLTVEYTDTQNPNNGGAAGGGDGLEAKGMITVKKVTSDGVTETESQLYKDTFGSITTAEVFDESEFSGGWGRIYLGISNGADGGTPFTNADEPGVYAGTITLTATLD